MSRRLVIAASLSIALLAAAAVVFVRSDGEDPPAGVQSEPGSTENAPQNEATRTPGTIPAEHPADDPYQQQRLQMVERQLRARDITDERVLTAMEAVPRHRFVSEGRRREAYADRPLSIGHNQTISQPYIVALMTQLAGVEPGDRVLDIGTGSGYQAAVLAEMDVEVYSIEIICELAEEARRRLQRLGYDNVEVRCGDGYQGWPEHAPFQAIIVAAAPDHVPQPLVDQLAEGGRLIIPVGRYFQELLVIEKQSDGSVSRESVAPVRFVPMTGEAERAAQ